MSLYRVASPRSRLLALLVPAAALVVGLVVGVLVGRATAPEPSLEDALAVPAAKVEEARNALEVLSIEYPQAVESETEYEGAQADVRHAQDAVEAARELQALDPTAYARALALVSQIAALVERKAPPATVAARIRAADSALNALPGAGSGSR